MPGIGIGFLILGIAHRIPGEPPCTALEVIALNAAVDKACKESGTMACNHATPCAKVAECVIKFE